MPKLHRSKLVVLMMFLWVILGAPTAVAAGIPGLGGSESAQSEVNLQEMSKEELDAHLATLSDEEARKLLLEQVEAQREEKRPGKRKPRWAAPTSRTPSIPCKNARSNTTGNASS